jgi:hypothetical protein
MSHTTPKTSDAHLLALQLIAQHGVKAPTYAAGKAEEMLREGNIYERHTWRRVQNEIEAVLAQGGPSDLLGNFPGHGFQLAEHAPSLFANSFDDALPLFGDKDARAPFRPVH